MPEKIVVVDLTLLGQRENKYYTITWDSRLVSAVNTELSDMSGRKVRIGTILASGYAWFFPDDSQLTTYTGVMGAASGNATPLYSAFVIADIDQANVLQKAYENRPQSQAASSR